MPSVTPYTPFSTVIITQIPKKGGIYFPRIFLAEFELEGGDGMDGNGYGDGKRKGLNR